MKTTINARRKKKMTTAIDKSEIYNYKDWPAIWVHGHLAPAVVNFLKTQNVVSKSFDYGGYVVIFLGEESYISILKLKIPKIPITVLTDYYKDIICEAYLRSNRTIKTKEDFKRKYEIESITPQVIWYEL